MIRGDIMNMRKITPLTSEKRDNEEKKIFKNLASQLKTARKSNNYTQEDIATYLGSTNAQICKIEKHNANPSFATIKLIADFLNVSLDSLCDNTELKPPSTSSPWIDVPPILAFLSILNRFQPIIELGENDDEPIVKLSFTFNHLLEQKEKFKDFFKQYQVIANLIDSNLECAEEVDILTSRLLEKYKDLNNPTSQKKNNR